MFCSQLFHRFMDGSIRSASHVMLTATACHPCNGQTPTPPLRIFVLGFFSPNPNIPYLRRFECRGSSHRSPSRTSLGRLPSSAVFVGSSRALRSKASGDRTASSPRIRVSGQTTRRPPSAPSFEALHVDRKTDWERSETVQDAT